MTCIYVAIKYECPPQLGLMPKTSQTSLKVLLRLIIGSNISLVYFCTKTY
jgi:hypothetical protein